MRMRSFSRILLAVTVVLTVAAPAGASPNPDRCSHTRGIQNIPGLLLWFSPEKLPDAPDGTPVNLWPDCSGNDFDAVQASPARTPVLRVNAIAGQSALEFDGIDDVLKLTGSALLNDISLFIVLRYQSMPGGDCAHAYPFSLGGDVNATGQYWGIETLSACSGYSVDVADIYGGFGNDARATLANISAPGLVNQLTVISAGSIHNTEVWVNGQPAAMSDEGVDVPLDVQLSGGPESSWNGIGGGTYPGDNKAAHVQIAEILVFGTALSTNERRRVERDLQARYGN